MTSKLHVAAERQPAADLCGSKIYCRHQVIDRLCLQNSEACYRDMAQKKHTAGQGGHVTTCNFRVIFARRGRGFPEILSFRVTTCNYAFKIARRGREATLSGEKHSAVTPNGNQAKHSAEKQLVARHSAANPQRDILQRKPAARHSAANPSDSDSKACGRHPVTRSPSAEQRSMLLGHVTTCNLRVIFARRGRDFPGILLFRVTTCNYALKIARRGREATLRQPAARHSAATLSGNPQRDILQRGIPQKPRHGREATRSEPGMEPSMGPGMGPDMEPGQGSRRG